METETRITTRTVRIDPRNLRLLEVNARYMRHETFMRLVENVRADGGLTSIPFAWRLHDDTARQPFEPTVYEVLSGNHRVKAAIAAGLDEIDVLVTDDYLPADRRKAIQLSHNSITGEDDPALLKLLYDGIENVGMRLYSGLDDKSLKLLSDVKAGGLSEPNLTFQTVMLTFLPGEVEAVEAAWAAAKKLAKGAAWLANFESYDAALNALEAASMAAGVKNTATALMIVLDVFSRHMDDLTELYLDEQGEPVEKGRRVPLDTIFGYEGVPAHIAAGLKRLIDREMGGGKVKHSWEVLAGLLNATGVEHGKSKPNKKRQGAREAID